MDLLLLFHMCSTSPQLPVFYALLYETNETCAKLVELHFTASQYTI